MTKSKKRGMGINAFFDQAPDEQAESPHPSADGSTTDESEVTQAAAPLEKVTQRVKIRNTFVIYEDTMKTLEMLRMLAEPKTTGDKSTKVTYGDLIDEAVQALLEKKSQDEDLEQKLKEALKINR